ncbi:glycosyltransferase family 4 protein [Thiobacter aerophilum]|uniref:Glycosyltransferase family 4 protein n=1 Tax=Thiobacter aerophilum TaxID=3121275 RepID=A0ABV0EH36_9BURK
MRLIVITELYLPTKGGTAVWFDQVYRRLGGKDIHVVTADVPGAAQHDAAHPNTVHRLSLRRHWWLRPESLAMYGKFFFKSLGLALRHRFQAVHAGRVLPEGLVAWLVARIARIPVVVYAHGEEITTWRQPAKFRVMGFVYRHADWVIANSEFTRDELTKLGVAPQRIVLIHPGVDTEHFRPGLPCDDLKASIGLAAHEKLILSVGRLSRRKGFDMVIRSLPELLKQGRPVRYALIGIGEDWDYLHSLARDCGVADRVHFLGHVPSEDLPRWYNACDVFAMPNREINGDTEGFGMVFLEAAACGKPALAGNAGGTGAAVVHGVTGLRIDANDVRPVSSALAQLLADDSGAQTMADQARARAHHEFDWAVVADRTRRLVKEAKR